jgi:hypothetical protein
MKLKLSIALLLTMVPSLAFARTHGTSAHLRPRLFHDRAPKLHTNIAKPH